MFFSLVLHPVRTYVGLLFGDLSLAAFQCSLFIRNHILKFVSEWIFVDQATAQMCFVKRNLKEEENLFRYTGY